VGQIVFLVLVFVQIDEVFQLARYPRRKAQHPNRGPGFTFHRFEVGFVGIRGYHLLALFLGGKGKDFLAGFIS
jgi:hypothetical protein